MGIFTDKEGDWCPVGPYRPAYKHLLRCPTCGSETTHECRVASKNIKDHYDWTSHYGIFCGDNCMQHREIIKSTLCPPSAIDFEHEAIRKKWIQTNRRVSFKDRCKAFWNYLWSDDI